MKVLVDFLTEPAIKGLDMDSAVRLDVHRKIENKKRMLRHVFKEFHELFRLFEKKYFDGAGIELEIGAGIAPMGRTYPSVLATDVVLGPHLDFVLDAQNMVDLADNTVRAIFGQNCFHHLPNPDLFFEELERVIAPGGGAILLEPYYGFLASMLFKHMFSSEGFDKNYPSWKTPQKGPMNGANQALSYIVFVRDRHLFPLSIQRLKLSILNR